VGLHPVPDRDDDVEVVELHLPLHRPVSFRLNRQGFLDSCRPLQLPFVVDVADVQADVLLRGLEQVRHVLLGEPDGFALEAHVDLQLPVLRLVDQELAAGRR